MSAERKIMASLKPATDHPRQAPKSRLWRRLFGFISVTSVALAPVAALALWVMISDPVTSAAVMERGDLLPVLGALVKMVGKALAAMMAML
jgi:hypothetical protein